MSEGTPNGSAPPPPPRKQRQRPVWATVGIALIIQASVLHMYYQWHVLQPCPPPPLPLTTWRSLSDFLQKCDKLPEPTLPGSRSRKQLEPPAPEPQTLLELFGAGPPPPDRPRDPQSLVTLMQNLSDVVQRCRHDGVCPTQQFSCVSDACPSYRPCPKKEKDKLRIALVTLTPPSDKVTMRMTEANHAWYSKKWGYDLWTVPPVDDGKKRHPVWSKLHGVLAVAHLYDWIWMIDDDALVMNTALPLTDFIDDRFNLIVANDCNGINFGSAIVRGGVWLEALFLQVYALPDAKPPWFEEQAALVAAINEIPRVKEKSQILPTNKGFNSYGAFAAKDCGTGAYTPGDFVVHFPGPGDKTKAILDYWNQLPMEQRNEMTALMKEIVGTPIV